MILLPLSNIERESLQNLAENAWRAAVEGDQLDQLNLLTMEGLADDMISCDADIETFSDTYGYEFTKEALVGMLPEITKKLTF